MPLNINVTALTFLDDIYVNAWFHIVKVLI